MPPPISVLEKLRRSNLRSLFSKRVILQSVRNFSEINILQSKVPQLEIPKNVSLHEYLWKNLCRWKDKTAAVCFETGREYTFEQLHKKSLSLASFLNNSLKLQEKDTVGIVLPNLLEYPVAVLGSIDAGLRVTTCNPGYTPDEIKRQLADAEVRLVFTSSSLAGQISKITQEIGPNIPVIVVDDTQDATSIEPSSFNPADRSGDDVVFLPYSSGTTSRPKGVQLTLNNIISNLHQMAADDFVWTVECQDNHQDVVPVQLPFFHIYGLVIIMLHGLSRGCKLVIMPKFGVNSFVTTLRKFRPTVLFAVPTMVNVITNNSGIEPKDLVSLRTIVSGAAPFGAADVERFYDKSRGRTDVIQVWGMTELSPLGLTQTKKFENACKIGGSGLLVPNTSAKIVPADGSSLVGLGPGKSGELLIRGPQVMKGYLKNPESTEATLLEDGWIRTGDVAHYDEHGEFFITDRIKELIKVKGLQVAPAELEEILRDHPLIDDAAVVGVSHPHLGEAPRAFVVPRGKSLFLTSSKVAEYVASKAARHKHLVGGVVFVDRIPKNPSGKILRRELKKLQLHS